MHHIFNNLTMGQSSSIGMFEFEKFVHTTFL